MNIQVSNLPENVFQSTIEGLFNKFGLVTTVVIHHNDNGIPVRGTVVMEEGGRKAIDTLNGYMLDDKRIKVEEISDEQEKLGENESENENTTKKNSVHR